MIPLRIIIISAFMLLGIMPASSQLAIEPIPSVETLPEKYPSHWLFAHDVSFFNLASGRVFIVDPAAKNKDIHGIIDAAQFANFSFSKKRGELYVAETFYSRGMRGDRSDFVTIYDTATLKIKDQVELPGGKRALIVTQKSGLQQTRNGKFLLIYNFTPAASVSIFDLDTRSVVNEVQLPGCSMIYPSGQNGFASLCGDGSMIAFDLDTTGQVLNEFTTDAFNDIDADPNFMKVTSVGNTVYFVSYKGYIQPVVLGGGMPEIRDRVYLTGSVRDTAHGALARPAGWQVITRDSRGRIYILMRPNAGDGDHKYGGSYVWVYDPGSQRVVNEIPLQSNSISIEVTGGSKPLLVATSELMHLDIYDLRSGDYVRTIGGWGPATPFTLHAVN